MIEKSSYYVYYLVNTLTLDLQAINRRKIVAFVYFIFSLVSHAQQALVVHDHLNYAEHTRFNYSNTSRLWKYDFSSAQGQRINLIMDTFMIRPNSYEAAGLSTYSNS